MIKKIIYGNFKNFDLKAKPNKGYKQNLHLKNEKSIKSINDMAQLSTISVLNFFFFHRE